MYTLFFFLFSSFLFAQPRGEKIKSLRTFRKGKPLELPIVFLNKNKSRKITIDFDVQSNEYPQLAIVFKFCDENWIPYNNAFLQNFGKDISTNLEFTKLPVTITRADYHFTGSYPNREVTFPFPGKWKYLITSEYDTSRVFAVGYFYVVRSLLNIESKIKKATIEGAISDNSELDRAFEIRTNFRIPPQLDPQRIKFVEIVPNQRIFNPYLIKPETTANKYFEWNGTNDFTFVIKDIQPGNEYRIIDFRNSKRFYGDNIFNYFNFPHVSRFYDFGKPDLNGGELLSNFNDEYSDYYDVPFELRLPDNFNKRVFLVGSFNNWKADPSFEMENENGLYSKVIELKRGRYDFQFVTSADTAYYPSELNWIELEGNFWETTNVYNIFIHYDSPERGGYDEIIGFSKIKSPGKWND